MPDRITIIGPGKTGSVFAAAIKTEGTDFSVAVCAPDNDAGRCADADRQSGRTGHNGFSKGKETETVIIDLPADQTKRTMELIGRELDSETIVLDCSPAKTDAAGWAKMYLEHPENYLGCWLADRILFLAAEKDTSETALQTAAALADRLGWEHCFSGPAEMDGMIDALSCLTDMSEEAVRGCLAGYIDINDRKNKTDLPAPSEVIRQTFFGGFLRKRKMD